MPLEIPEKIPPLGKKAPEELETSIPSLKDLGIAAPEAESLIKGGETEGIKLM